MKEILITIVIVTIIAVSLHVAWPDTVPDAIPKYTIGQMVTTKVGNHTGMVIGKHCFQTGCFYDVRFNGADIFTNTHLTGSDSAVTFTPLATMEWMKEFELEKTK